MTQISCSVTPGGWAREWTRRPEMAQGRVGDHEQPEDVDVEERAPPIRAPGREGRHGLHAGHVEVRVEPAQRVGRPVHRRAGFRFLGNVPEAPTAYGLPCPPDEGHSGTSI
jgi:hypothetical protein